MVIHGGIDGYSRMVVYLHCSTNNLSQTVGGLFTQATREFCWPSRVRSDKGTENVLVARMMIDKHGEGRGSIIQGSSVHNQRIERLWKDVRRTVVEFFRRLFYFMEANGLLNPSDECDLFCLHYVFLPRINSNLDRFKLAWNNHKLSSMKCKTPNQLYILGMLNLFGSDYRAVNEFFEGGTVDNTFGVDLPDDAVETTDTDNNVVVPEVTYQISEQCRQELDASIEVLAKDNNCGIPTFIKTKEIVQRHAGRH